MKIRCVITDDEPMARKGLAGYVANVDFLELVAVCEDAMSLNRVLAENQVDLVFLDIEMPLINGTEFLKTLENPPLVVFTTAYDQYAIDGFELNVLDYLLKPISFERFLKAVNRAREQTQRPVIVIKETDEYFFIRVDHRLEKVAWSDILFVEALENYVAIQTNGPKLMTLATLKSVMEKLPGDRFIQTHKSYLVSIQKIDSIEGNILHLGAFRVPVSKYMKAEVMERILNARVLKK